MGMIENDSNEEDMIESTQDEINEVENNYEEKKSWDSDKFIASVVIGSILYTILAAILIFLSIDQGWKILFKIGLGLIGYSVFQCLLVLILKNRVPKFLKSILYGINGLSRIVVWLLQAFFS